MVLPHAIGSILLFRSDKIPADRLGAALDRRGFCVRSGFHCSAAGHATLGTPPSGAVRVSPGIYNTRGQMELLADAVEEILRSGG